MTEQDKLKKEALEKLERLVKAELKYLEDTGKTLDNFTSEHIRDKFSEDEVKEIRNSLESLLTHRFLFRYCKITGIESKVLEDYKKTINDKCDSN